MAGKTVRKLILEDGEEYIGYAFGDLKETVFEIVFNTSMVGYQEILSDPAYTDQGVVMSYPLIGNYGMADDDYEARAMTAGALIVSEYNDAPSNFRSTKSLSEAMQDNGIPGIEGIDTRRLTRSIRDKGCRRACLVSADVSLEEGLRRIKETPLPHDAVRRVSCRRRFYSRTANPRFQVVAIDCGITLDAIRELNGSGCNVTVVPFDTAAADVLAMHPNGVFISNGPGNPEDVQEVISLVRELRGKLPIFGVGLGHQLICLAYGAKVYKLKFGHRGSNHPVLHTESGKVEIVSQNHGYAVDEDSLAECGLTVTCRNLLDGTVEGVKAVEDPVFSAQYSPDSTEVSDLFEQFSSMMKEAK